MELDMLIQKTLFLSQVMEVGAMHYLTELSRCSEMLLKENPAAVVKHKLVDRDMWPGSRTISMQGEGRIILKGLRL